MLYIIYLICYYYLYIVCNIDQSEHPVFIKNLGELTNLVNLHLEDNNIDDNSIKMMCAALTNTTKLKKLDLGGNKISPEGLYSLANHLTSLPSLAGLVLKNNIIGTKISEQQMAVIEYILSWMPFPEPEEITPPKALLTLGEQLTCLKDLDLLDISGNKIKGEDLEGFFEELHNCTKLTVLGLHDNELGDIGMKHLAGNLKNVKSLKRLTLGFNSINAVGGKILCKELSNLKNLNALGLERILHIKHY